MMSSKNEDVNTKVNPDVIQVNRFDLLDTEHNPEMWKGWMNWSLQDIVRMLKDMAKSGEAHGMTAVVMRNIVFSKLLEAAADKNFPFEVIEETVRTALKARYSLKSIVF